LKILFIVPYPSEGASNRFRVEQYLPYLRQAGVRYLLRPFLNAAFYRILFKKGGYLKKLILFIFLSMRRLYDVVRCINYDIVFIHRQAYPLGSFFERLFKVFGKKMIYDFDDALFLPNTSDSNKFIGALKGCAKIRKLIQMSDYVIAGNNFLSGYALKFNKNTAVISTPIDSDRYIPAEKGMVKDEVIIGWMGSATTVKYLDILAGVFPQLFKKYPRARLIIVGGHWRRLTLPQIASRDWALRDEIADLQSFDIGIMPLCDDDWARGKCAFKAIEYMSVGIPVVASDVGMNKEVIRHGVNGFLANTDQEWISYLGSLISDGALRKKMGLAGRGIVEEEYSVKINAPKFMSIMREVYNSKG